MRVLSEEQLHKCAPSVFASAPSSNTSNQYTLVPTIEIVRGLGQQGYLPVMASESRCRNAENRPYAKHMIRFRADGQAEVGGNVPEIVLINSHDGKSSYQLRAGIYRLVCSNGLIIGNDIFCQRIRHSGDILGNVIEGYAELVQKLPETLRIADHWKGIELSREEQTAFADAAKALRWDEGIEVNSNSLLIPRRQADTEPNLWNTFNVVQEKLIRGGVRVRDPLTHSAHRAREIKSVSENARLNQALWKLSESMAQLKSA